MDVIIDHYTLLPHSHLRQYSRLGAIGLYRENAIAIESEANDSFGGNVYYVTMQITLPIPEFTRNERNFHCDILHVAPIESSPSFWMMRSQRSRRRDKGLFNCYVTLFSRKLDPNPPPRNANNVEYFTFVTLFF